ncbi:single-stranded DNA-binding protein [Candidatus Peregrinibacteria bacterium]|nr:single-stranded DNA-binding protein [Candidatus Peregrinibacteria bacterium]
MRSVNKVILVGNITRDPEIKQTTTGQSIVTFGLATNREWVTSKGEKQSLAEYHNLVAWGKLAEICKQYLKKGKLIYVEGYLKTRSWDSPEGVKIFKTEVVIYDMIMLEKRPRDEEGIDSPDDFIPGENDAFDPLADIGGEISDKNTSK